MLDSDMPSQAMRLAMGELNGGEMRAARAAIAWANTTAIADLKKRLVERLKDEKMITPCHQDANRYFNVGISAAIDVINEVMGE